MGEIERKFSAFLIRSVVPLRNRMYYYFLKDAIKSARYRIWTSMFIINISREYDIQQDVLNILKLLTYKNSLGLDVRVIIGDSDDVPEIREVNEIARRYLKSKKVHVKKYKGSKQSTHSKYIIIDDKLIIVGSHNWTNNAINKSEEDAVAIWSESLNNELQYQFLSTWVD